MEYKFFDKQFLVMPDDKDIIGKKVLYHDNLYHLIEEVESGDSGRAGCVEHVDDDSYGSPFCINNGHWSLAYYDPNYKAKVAYSQGKQIQFRSFQGEWVDVEKPTWCERDVYRIKPEWYVHEVNGEFYKDNYNNVYVEFEGTEKECDAWIAEHTPKTRRMTNKELAKWCADNKGQVMYGMGYALTHWAYKPELDNEEVPDNTLMREWDSDKWHEPLVEVKE